MPLPAIRLPVRRPTWLGSRDRAVQLPPAAWLAVGGLAAWALAACSGVGADRSLATERDSAGITIVENRSPADSAALPWLTIVGPTLDVGGAGAEGDDALFRVNTAIRLTDGSVVIGNGGSLELRRFAADGTRLGSSGRGGEGPGEFRTISALARGRGDTVLVHDAGLRRLSVYTGDGAFVRDFRLGVASSGPIIGTFADLTIVATVGLPNSDPGSASMATGRVRPDAYVVRFAADGAVLDTLGRFPTTERMIRTTTQGGTIVSIQISQLPFGAATSFATTGDWLAVGTQDESGIRIYDMEGGLRRIVRLGRPIEPVTVELRDAWIERRMETVPPELQVDVRRTYEEQPMVEAIPTHGRILFDDEGRLWVEDPDRPDIPPGRWTVYGADGRLIGRIALPGRFRPLDIARGEIVGIWLDDLDVEHLQRFTIVH